MCVLDITSTAAVSSVTQVREYRGHEASTAVSRVGFRKYDALVLNRNEEEGDQHSTSPPPFVFRMFSCSC